MSGEIRTCFICGREFDSDDRDAFAIFIDGEAYIRPGLAAVQNVCKVCQINKPDNVTLWRAQGSYP